MTNPRVANGHRRREVRKRILKEEDNCGICGKPVDKTLHYLDPQAPEIDEIIPVSLGGSATKRSNCRLTHRICNQKRGNRVDYQPPTTKPLNTSRQW